MGPALGILDAEEAVRGHWEFRVRSRERHLDCVLYPFTLAPGKETQLRKRADGSEDCTDASDEKGVRDVQVADLLVLGVEIGLGALFGCTGAKQTPPARRECPGSVRSNATAASYLNASPVGVPDVSGTATGQTLNYTQSLTTVTDRSQVVAMIENAHRRAQGVPAGSTLRGTLLNSCAGLVDSNGPITPAGSTSLGMTGQFSTDYGASVMVAIRG